MTIFPVQKLDHLFDGESLRQLFTNELLLLDGALRHVALACRQGKFSASSAPNRLGELAEE